MVFQERKIREALRFYNQTSDCVIWKDLNSNYKMINDQYAKLVGLESSLASFEGFSDHTIPCQAAALADQFIEADQCVIRTGKMITRIEFCCYQDGQQRMHYDRKSPLFNSVGEIIGVCCYGIDVTDCPLMRSILALTSIAGQPYSSIAGNQISFRLQSSYDQFGLTTRQSETLFYMIRGKTAKEIGRCLGISYRVVEKHQLLLKEKMGCQHKSQVIEKAIAGGLALVIPQSLMGIL